MRARADAAPEPSPDCLGSGCPALHSIFGDAWELHSFDRRLTDLSPSAASNTARGRRAPPRIRRRAPSWAAPTARAKKSPSAAPGPGGGGGEGGGGELLLVSIRESGTSAARAGEAARARRRARGGLGGGRRGGLREEGLGREAVMRRWEAVMRRSSG